MRQLYVSLSAVLALAASGCDQNSSGNVRSTKVGDTSHPATRSSPVTPLRQACNAEGGMLPEATMIARKPYVQQITDRSATIGWVTSAPGGQTVEVTKPEVAASASAPAERDNSVDRALTESQMWSTVTGLEPDTIYCYRVLVNGQPVTQPIGFRTAPSADSTRTIGMLVFGDSGDGGSDQWALRAQMEEVPYELIIHTGDVAYETGTLDQYEANVFDIYADLFRHIPFFPAAGNHDYHTAAAKPFQEVFKLPENGGAEKYYSYDWGRVHLAALDTEDDYKKQMAWLDQDMAASTAPWKVVYMHRPPYSSGSHGSDTNLRTLLAPLVKKHGIQLIFAGHDHDYERMKLDVDGRQYITTGGGGRGTYPVGTSSFTAFSSEVIHYVYVEFGVDEAIIHAIDGTGVEFDSAVVAR